MSEAGLVDITSTWFRWHEGIIRPGSTVLDVGCGEGRHAIAAAQLGAKVVAVDSNAEKLRTASEKAGACAVSVDWVHADLERDALPPGEFDVVMVFYYLDRRRMREFLNAVKPGGMFLAETFRNGQRELDSGPKCEDYLLMDCELLDLVKPLEVILAREVVEEFNEHQKVIASVLAERTK
ncbi:MAG: class I SAM-dependent methyltransferase [Gemmatimonadales bacterium]